MTPTTASQRGTAAKPAAATSEPLFGRAGASWKIDPGESVARFVAATAWGRIPVTGRLGTVSGSLTWDGHTGRGQMAISTRALASGIKLRDHHLRGRAFFHVHEHPQINFDATEVLAHGNTVRLRGKLVLRGRRHDFECTATASAVRPQRIALDADAEFDLDELGMSRGMLRMIPASVTARIRVVLERELS